jgi:hypothetical protein
MSLDAIDEVILTRLYAGPQSIAELGKALRQSHGLIEARIDQLMIAGRVAFDLNDSRINRYKVVRAPQRVDSESVESTVDGAAHSSGLRPRVAQDEQLRKFSDNCMAARHR